MLQLPDQHNQNVPFKPGDNRNVPAELICWWKLPENWDLKREEGVDSTLTAVGEEPGGGLHASDWLVFKSDWQNCPVGGWDRSQGRGISVVLLAFRQQVTDLLLQLRADGVLSQNQNTQTGGVVLNHVQEHLHRNSQNICHPLLMTPQQQLKNWSRISVKGARSPAGSVMVGLPVQIDWSDQFLPDPELPVFCSTRQPLPASLQSDHLQRDQEGLSQKNDQNSVSEQ